jgi:hypothetical protein
MKDKSTSEFPNKVSDAKKVAYCIDDDDDVLLKARYKSCTER